MERLTTPELKRLLIDRPNIFLLDVRDPEEYEAGHIAKSILAPWEDITKRVDGMKKDTNLVLYCNTGVRALKAGKALEDNGYTQITVCTGGWAEWDTTNYQ